MKPLVILGSNVGYEVNPETVARILKREQTKKNSKPAWFDGSYFYTVSGKYSYHHPTGLLKLHDLSIDGIFNHFEPCDYVSYNAECLKQYEIRQAEAKKIDEQKQMQDKLEKEQAAKVYRKTLAYCEKIDAWIKANKSRKRRGEFLIDTPSGKKLQQGFKFVDFGIHKREGCKETPHHVTHLHTGKRVGEFETQKAAINFVFAVQNLWDWVFDKLELAQFSEESLKNIATLQIYVRGNRPLSDEYIEQLAQFIERRSS